MNPNQAEPMPAKEFNDLLTVWKADLCAMAPRQRTYAVRELVKVKRELRERGL